MSGTLHLAQTRSNRGRCGREGEANPAGLAVMADKNLRATQEQLCDALDACAELKPIYRRLLKMFLEELQLIEQ